MKPADHALFLLWEGGDRRAGSALLGRYQLALRRFFRRKSSDGVDDLLQQTMLAVLDGRARIGDSERFRAYLFGTARLVLIEHFRSRKKSSRLTSYDETEHTRSLVSQPAELAAPADLALAMARLPAEFQQVLQLTYWEQLRAPEIATMLRIPLATVYSRLRRAKTKLHGIYKELDTVGPARVSRARPNEARRGRGMRLHAPPRTPHNDGEPTA